MQKVIAITAIFCVMAIQGCTTNRHTHIHYNTADPIGIANKPTGEKGKAGEAGMPKSPQAQRKEEIDKSLLPHPGAKGAFGDIRSQGAHGAIMTHTAPKEEEYSNELDWSFAKKAAMKILEWCILAKCGR